MDSRISYRHSRVSNRHSRVSGNPAVLRTLDSCDTLPLFPPPPTIIPAPPYRHSRNHYRHSRVSGNPDGTAL